MPIVSTLVRAVLIVNPNATSTTPAGRDLLAHALESRVKLVVAHTDHRGHAIEIAESAKRDGTGVIIVHGGDGTVNEVVNGLLGPPGLDRSTLGSRYCGVHPTAASAGHLVHGRRFTPMDLRRADRRCGLGCPGAAVQPGHVALAVLLGAHRQTRWSGSG